LHLQESIDDIWSLQSWLLDETDREGIRIVENWYIEDTVRAILDLVIGELMKHFPPQPDDEVWEA
jgi:2-phosphoglycerate kinase